MNRIREASSASFPGRRSGPPKLHSQRGLVMLLTVFLLMLGVAAVGVTYYRPAPAAKLNDDRTAEVFADVKAALVGYAARQGVFQCSNPANTTACQNELNASSKLGEFPCPDITGDGVAEAACATERIGRVPWKTLGIPEPRDSAGETLWYAVSFRFLNNASNPIVKAFRNAPLIGGDYTSSGAINSSTPGDLEVRGANGTAITTEAIAVIFSPGAPLGTQRRSVTATASCAATGTTLPEYRCPSNYLEASGTANNAKVGGPFIAGTPGGAFNDRLVFISAGEVVPMLEMRLGKEMQALLTKYKDNSVCQCYPWADSWSYSLGTADLGVNRGRIASDTEPDEWGGANIPIFPAWVKDNDWHNHFYYSVSKRESDPSGSGCLTCSNKLDLAVKDSSSPTAPVKSAAVVLITPGTSRPGYIRAFFPADVFNHPLRNSFAAFFEDPENNNKASCPGINTEHASNPAGSGFTKSIAADACDTFVQPSSKAYDRDRLWMIPAETLASICSKGGPALMSNTPCKDNSDPDKVKNVCTSLRNKLQQCSSTCAAAAQKMIETPCRNDQSSSQCPPYYAALLACSAP